MINNSDIDSVKIVFKEKEEKNNEENIEIMMKELEQIVCKSQCFENQELFYQEQTIKYLLKISNYYGLNKDIKNSKCKKQDIIATIVYFESLPENINIVNKRNRMWVCMSELYNDLKMKKFIIWD